MNLYAPEKQSAKAQKRWGPKGSTFWSKVDKSGGEDACWPWLGRTQNGYGCAPIGGKEQTEYAHRRAYGYSKGSPKGHVIRHTCDNPICCNPKHLLAGTTLDNVMDKVNKGRARGGARCSQKGSSNNAAKITEIQAKSVLELYTLKVSQTEIARKTGVKKSNVWSIVHRKSWSHLLNIS